MRQPLAHLVAAMTFAVAACGGKGSSPDGGTTGSAGSGAAGHGGAGGAGGSGGSAPAGRGGNGGTAGGTAGSAGAGGSGGATGAGGAGGAAAGSGGAAGTGGRGGGAGGGAAGTGGDGAGTAGSGGGAGVASGGGGSGGAGGGGTGGVPVASCTSPTDCVGAPQTSASSFCSLPSWSCVNGTCAWECMGGRTCTEAPDSGCLLCSTGAGTPMSQGCLGTPCLIDPAKILNVTQLTCQSSPPPDFSTWHCTGSWAVPSGGGAPCTLEGVASGLFRVSVTCGPCVTIVSEN
jgi:hypothetical protein